MGDGKKDKRKDACFIMFRASSKVSCMEVDVSKSPHAPRLDSEEVPASPILIVFHELMGFSELMIEGISNAKNLPRTYRSFVQWNLDFPGPSEARKTLFSVSRILQISIFGRQQRDNVFLGFHSGT